MLLLAAAAALVLALAQTRYACGDGPLDAGEYAASARTGDILLFRRKDVDLLHDIVSTYTHAALVVSPGGPGGGGAVTVETHTAETIDGRPRPPGVASYDLRRRLASADAELFVMRARRELPADAVLEAARRLKRTPYPRGMRTHVAACKLLGRDDGAMVCSELVARLLGWPWRCATPADLVAMAAEGSHDCVRRIRPGAPHFFAAYEQ